MIITHHNMQHLYSSRHGPVDQLEDRYLGMVEATGSNPARSIPIYGSNLHTKQ